MIDPNLPLELDDGTPVHRIKEGRGYVVVDVPKNVRRDGLEEHTYNNPGRGWYFFLKTGDFDGDYKNEFYKIRNAVDEPEDFEYDV